MYKDESRDTSNDIHEKDLLGVFYQKSIHNQVIIFKLVNSADTKLNIIMIVMVYLIIKTW